MSQKIAHMGRRCKLKNLKKGQQQVQPPQASYPCSVLIFWHKFLGKQSHIGMDHLNGDKCVWSHFHFFTKVFYKFLGSSQTWPSLAGHPLTNKSMKCCQKTSGLIRKYIFLWKLISLLSIWINLQWSPLDCSNFSIHQFTKFGDKITKNGHKITVTFRWPIP